MDESWPALYAPSNMMADSIRSQRATIKLWDSDFIDFSDYLSKEKVLVVWTRDK